MEARYKLNTTMLEKTERNKELYEYAYGLNGREKLTEYQLAGKYGITPSAVSKIKKHFKIKYGTANIS